MSDFKVIKCKKCDAGLVELSGQKLANCNQCGYVFFNGNKKPQQRSSRTINNTSTMQQEKNSIEAKISSSAFKNTPEMQALARKLRALKNSMQSSESQIEERGEAPQALPKKKKGITFGTIIFWIIAFNFLRMIFKV